MTLSRYKVTRLAAPAVGHSRNGNCGNQMSVKHGSPLASSEPWPCVCCCRTQESRCVCIFDLGHFCFFLPSQKKLWKPQILQNPSWDVCEWSPAGCSLCWPHCGNACSASPFGLLVPPIWKQLWLPYYHTKGPISLHMNHVLIIPQP